MFNLFKNGKDTGIRFDRDTWNGALDLFYLRLKLRTIDVIETSYGKMIIEEPDKSSDKDEPKFTTYELIEGTR